jgi:hypothetical protein
MSAPARLRRWFLASLLGSGLALMALSVNGIAQMDSTLAAAPVQATSEDGDRDCPKPFDDKPKTRDL